MNSYQWLDVVQNVQRRKAQRAVIADLCRVGDDWRKEREEYLKRQAEDKARTQRAEEAQIKLAGQVQEEIVLLKSQLDVLKSSNEELRAANEQIAATNKELETANGQLEVAKLDSDRAARTAKRWNVIMLCASLLATLVAVIGWNESWKQLVSQAIGLK